MDIETVVTRFRTQLPHRFKIAEGGKTILCGVLIDVDETTGRARSIERLSRYDG
jgi:calcineurin-like phosphoesterase